MTEREPGQGEVLGSRAVALYLTGFAAFVGLYLPQPILPLLRAEFGLTPQSSALLISATIFGIALASPLIGVLSDRFGRLRILAGGSFLLALASLACALAPGFPSLLAARFAQGLVLPALMAVGIAYVSETLSGRQMRFVAGIYVACTVIGGMGGRVLAGAMADVTGWRYAFLVPTALYLALVPLWWRLPRLLRTEPTPGLLAALRGTAGHLRNRSLLGGLAVGFFLFFAFQSTFSYLPFHLEAPPFALSNTLIGLTYLSYASGVLSSGFAGWYAARTSLRIALVTGFALTIGGNLLALTPSLALLFGGLVILCFGNFLVQGLAVGYVATSVEHDRAGANALYLLLYYLGGSLGAFLPGYLFDAFGFFGVVIASISALAVGLAAAALLTGRTPRRAAAGQEA